MSTDIPDFEIPQRPRREYPRDGGVVFAGQTIFTLSPTPEQSDTALESLVVGVLEDDPYTFGDWFDLPMPLFLVYDRETGDVFRVAVRGGAIEFHVLPATEPEGLRALYQRLDAVSDCAWAVACRLAD
ncbi:MULTISPECIES: hypothetical protein [unclassified Haladaptatus]|uniref:hypothetical protein n=1 Tax=unclassified Haladaptatus TaxID=2622732 RepID=UPI0023E8EFF7|nr:MULTISPECIES: hypothetical protein [unclassified Haladaptatus]